MRTSIYIIIIALIEVLTSGCSVEKRLGRLLVKYPIPPVITYTPGPIEYRDTTITEYFPGDTVFEVLDLDDLLASIECPEMPEIEPIHAETELASVDVWVDEGKLKVRLIQYDRLFQFRLDSAIRVSRDTVWMDRVVPVEVKVIPQSHYFYKYGFFTTLGILLLVITLMLLFLKKK